MTSPFLLHFFWWVLFLIIAAGTLMLSYGLVTRQRLPFVRAFVLQLGLFLINAFLWVLVPFIPLREVFWWILAAFYFRWFLGLRFVHALIVTLLQRILYFVFVVYIFLPAVTVGP